MDTACLRHCLTDEERRHFEEQGYLLVPDALREDQRLRLLDAVDRLDAEQRRNGLGPHDRLFLPNFVARAPAFLELVDHPVTLPKVWGLLGWNIYLYHTHLGVDPPAAEGERVWRTLGWHQDSGRVNVDIDTRPRPRLSLKVAYFLTDMTEAGRGNFWVIPGSHLRDDLDRPTDGVSDPEGALPVRVPAGTAVFFDRRLWHAASPNWSTLTRKVLFYGYGYRWIRTKDEMTIPPEVLEASDPVRRQLLGWAPSANSRFSPKEEDVPLLAWLKGHRPEDAR